MLLGSVFMTLCVLVRVCVSTLSFVTSMRLSAANKMGCFPAVSLQRVVHMLLQHHCDQFVTLL